MRIYGLIKVGEGRIYIFFLREEHFTSVHLNCVTVHILPHSVYNFLQSYIENLPFQYNLQSRGTFRRVLPCTIPNETEKEIIKTY